MRTLAYGPLPSQVGDLYIPSGKPASLICLLHGGFWRMPWGRANMAPIAIDLCGRGYAVWNLEYRRVDEPGGGWPGTLLDVSAGIDHLAALAAQGERFDPRCVTVMGHSAGGQLALWSAARDASDGPAHQPRRMRIGAAVGLAPVADLEHAHRLHCGAGAVEAFLGSTPEEHPERYRTASPAHLLPLGVPQLIIHGTHDEDVPIDISRCYSQAAKDSDDEICFIELPTAAHMDFVDPESAAHARVCAWLELRARAAAS